MELNISAGQSRLEEILINDRIGQFPYEAPSVFNFFQYDYQPDGLLKDAGLVAPEAGLLTAPNIIAFVNAVQSIVKWGLTDCDSGIGGYAPSHLLAFSRAANIRAFFSLDVSIYMSGV